VRATGVRLSSNLFCNQRADKRMTYTADIKGACDVTSDRLACAVVLPQSDLLACLGSVAWDQVRSAVGGTL